MGAQFTATSDCRSKKNIKDLPYGLDFINLLRPVSYKWKPQEDKLDKDGNLIAEGELFHTHQRTMFGLLGQQVLFLNIYYVPPRRIHPWRPGQASAPVQHLRVQGCRRQDARHAEAGSIQVRISVS